MAKDIYDMTVRDLVDSGAKVSVTYHHAGSESVAKSILEEFEEVSDKVVNKGISAPETKWIEMDDMSVNVTAFYEDDGNE